jgi:hypothetical protein
MDDFNYYLVDCGTGEIRGKFSDLKKAEEELLKNYLIHISMVVLERLNGQWINRIDPKYPLHLKEYSNPWWEKREKYNQPPIGGI